MNEQSDYTLFINTLKEASVCKAYPDFLLEWKETGRTWNDADGECICGHWIKEEVHIRNKFNGRQLVVGNVCIKQFAKEIVTKKCCYCGLSVRRKKTETKQLCPLCKADKHVKGGKFQGKTLYWLAKNGKEYVDWLLSKRGELHSNWVMRIYAWADRRKENKWIDSDIEEHTPPPTPQKKCVAGAGGGAGTETN